MIYTSGSLRLKEVSKVSEGEINDNLIVKEEGSGNGILYSLVLIKDHEAVRTLLDIFRTARIQGTSPVTDKFSAGNNYAIVLPYRSERPLRDFFVSEAEELSTCELVCANVILACISAGLPFPLLYLMLTQGRLNISKDHNIYFSYFIDLKDMDPSKTERDCASECAKILLEILESKPDSKNVAYEILLRKSENRSYHGFTDLYRDMMIASAPTKKRGIFKRIRAFFYRNRDTIFGLLFWICLILGIVALMLLFSHLFVGDVPLLRIFFNSFKKIGTETLVQ